MAAVGLLESLMTAQIVDDLTDTPSDKRREMRGPGHRQLRHRLPRRHGRLRDDRPVGDQREVGRRDAGSRPSSPALFLLFLLVVLGPLVGQIPMPALVAVMIMVSIGTFSWRSIRDIAPPPVAVLGGDAGDGRRRRLDPRSGAGRAGGRAALRHLLRRQGPADVHRRLGAVGGRAHAAPTASRARSSSPRRTPSSRPSTSSEVLDARGDRRQPARISGTSRRSARSTRWC